jgi:hypothetical protein
MAAITPEVPVAISTPGERPAYTWAAIAAIVVILSGFMPSYYLKAFFGTPELTTLKHVHGLVMSAWFALLLVQVRLVATGNTATHRKLGVAGAIVAVLVVIVGIQLGIASARAGFTPMPRIPPLVFLVMPIGEMVVFTLFIGTALALRRKSAWHKRLMVIGSLAILTPAMARIPVLRDGGPLAFFAAVDLLIIAFMAFDWMKNRRVHPAYIAGLATLVVSQIGRLALTRTEAWMSFAKWLTA